MAAPGQSRTAQVRAQQLPGDPGTMVLTITGRVTRAAIPDICKRVHHLLETSKATRLICDVSDVVEPDAVALDALARLQLTGKRLGYQIKICFACDELRDLIDWSGLSDVVPVSET